MFSVKSLPSCRLIVFLSLSLARPMIASAASSAVTQLTSRDQEVKQIGMVIEHDGDSRGVIMPKRQRPNRLRWLLEVPQLDSRVARLAVQNDHAAKPRREPRRPVHVVQTVAALGAIGRLGSWCSSMSWMSRAMTSCHDRLMAEPILSSDMPGAKSLQSRR